MEENVKLVYVQKTDKRYFKTDPIWQYDVGHVLDLHEFDTLPETFQVHFSHNPSGDAVTQIGQNGACSVPDSFAQVAKTIYAWIYVATVDAGLTKYFIEMPVARKGKPSDQEPEPVEQSVIDQAIAALNAGVDRAEDAADAAEAAQAGAEAAEQGAIAAQQTAQAAARTAADKVTEATAQADRAETAAQNAEGSATAAAGSATSAASFAQSATSASQAAAQSARVTAQAGAEADRDAKAAAASAATAASEAANAAQSASQAEHTVQDASAQADRAEQAADDADAAKAGAETARTGAETAQSAAAGSATAAAGSASAAQTSAGNAASSATAAAQSAQASAQTAAQFEQDITELKSDIESKQNKPVIPGTEGQVLSLDANGNPVWANVQTDSEIDDSITADDSTWSSEKISEALQDKADVIISSASGAIASFPDGAAAPVEKLVVNVEPVQDLHGYDSPWPAGGGKNKFDVTEIVQNEILTVNNGVISVTGNGVNSGKRLRELAKLVVGETYYLTASTTGSANYIYLSTAGNSWYFSTIRTITEEDLDSRVMFYSGASGTTARISDFMIRLNSETDGTFTPYSNICPISGWDGVNVWDDPKHGGNIEWNQHIVNGNFNDGLTKWAIFRGTAVAVDNKLVYTVETKSAYQYINQGGIPYVLGHKVLVSFVITLSEANSVGVGDGSSILKTYSLSANQRTQIDYMTTLGTANKTDFTIYIYPGRSDGLSVGAVATIENVMFFDLTQMFGAGNEPSTVEDFKAMFPKDYYPFDDSYTETCVSTVNGDPYRHFQIEFPSEAGAVYGGTLTVNSDWTGELVVDRAKVNLGAFDFTTLSTPESHIFRAPYQNVIPDILPHPNGNMDYGDLCEEYVYKNWTPISGADNGCFSISGIDLNKLVVIDHRFTDVISFQNAVRDVALVYYLAAPLTYTLTAEQISGILTTVKGQNDVWSDAGEVEVTYRADTKLYIDNKLTELVAQIVNS